MEYIVMVAVAALGLWATWLSGRDVGMRNAARMAGEQEDTTLMLKVETKGDHTAPPGRRFSSSAWTTPES